VSAVLARIERIDPSLNAYRVVMAESALAAAQASDRRRVRGDRGPLLGVPLAVKDDIDVAGQATAVGGELSTRVATEDAEVVRRLLTAGAIMLGKTNVPELTLWPVTASATWGTTRNPWALDRHAGGSSGGSAAAVAAALASGAIGSDAAGSIRTPAAWCGLCGLKPTRGRVPVTPGRESWQGLVALGPLGRTAGDAALLLDAIADGAPPGGFAAAAGRLPPRLRIAVVSGLNLGGGSVADAVVEGVEEAARALGRAGHAVCRRRVAFAAADSTAFTIRFLAGASDLHQRVAPIERRSARVAALGGMLPKPAITWARAREGRTRGRVLAALADADVLLAPGPATLPLPVERLAATGAIRSLAEAGRIVAHLAPASVTGLPAMSVAITPGSDGLPRAVQLIARAGEEATLLSLAAQFEAIFGAAATRPAAVG
jgi:amidase